MLLALDGYFIGFARIVQYQSVVFLMVALVALILYRLVRRPQDLARYLTLAAIFLATGLLAHYEAALVALPGAYLLYALWRRHPAISLVRLGRALIAPILAGGALLAVFYVPFVLNPSFRITYAYITVNRIGSTFPYNNLVDVFERTTLYSSVYYVALLVICAVLSLAAIYRRNLPRIWGWVAAALLVAGVLITLWQPAWIVIGGHDHTWAFYAAALVIAWFLPDFPLEQRLAWLWFGSGAVFMLFFTLTPNTHVYGFFIPWALVAGEALGRGWLWLRRRLGARPAARIAAVTAALAVLVFGNYVYWYFAATDLEVLRTWRENRPRGYPVTYDMPTRMSIFGFPLKNGWKAVGALYADGVLDAPFEVHGKEPVADWYTRGAGYCPRDHVYYIWHESVEPADLGYNTVVREQIEADGYQLFGTVLVNEQPRLRIYTSDDAPVTPQTYRVEDFEQRFDRELSGPIFELDGPSAAIHMQHELDLRLGDGIRLRGYSLDRTEAKPGEGVLLTLYWQAGKPLQTAYSVFTQIIDMTDYHKAGQRDGEPVCNQLPSDFWLPGDTIVDRYYIPIFADVAALCSYRLLVGMYDSETGDRLDIRRTARHLGRRRASRHHGHAAMIAAESGESGRSKGRRLRAHGASPKLRALLAALLMAASSGCRVAWPSTASSLRTNTPGLPAPATSSFPRPGRFCRRLPAPPSRRHRHLGGVSRLHRLPVLCPRRSRLFRLVHGGDRAVLAQPGAMIRSSCWRRAAPSSYCRLPRSTLAFVLAVRLFGLWLKSARFALPFSLPHRPLAAAAPRRHGQQLHVPITDGVPGLFPGTLLLRTDPVGSGGGPGLADVYLFLLPFMAALGAGRGPFLSGTARLLLATEAAAD